MQTIARGSVRMSEVNTQRIFSCYKIFLRKTHKPFFVLPFCWLAIHVHGLNVATIKV